MEYNTYIPQGPLSKYIQRYWTLENDDVSEAPTRDRIFPDGCIELLFNYGDRFKKYEGDKALWQPVSFIHGQLKQFIEVERTGTVGIFSVRFRPHGLRPFVSFAVDEATDSMLPITELWGDAGDVLAQQVVSAGSTEERIRLVEDFFENRCNPSVDKNDTVHQCVERIEKSMGTISIDRLAADLCVGRRHLERKFSEHVGLGPKLFARIIRFNYVLHLIEDKAENSFAHLAQEGGFYDQAHFIKDFKDFTGLNPGSYFSEELDLVKFFNLEK